MLSIVTGGVVVDMDGSRSRLTSGGHENTGGRPRASEDAPSDVAPSSALTFGLAELGRKARVLEARRITRLAHMNEVRRFAAEGR